VHHFGFPHAAQVLQATRRTRQLGTRRWRTVTIYAVTSLTFAQASPARLADYPRGHWAIENLKQVAAAWPRRQLHVICDNYATHKHPRVRAWLAMHPRIQLHFTPTSASWLDLVEVFFSIVERQALRRGNFASVTDLIAAIDRFCVAWNQHCQPFAWTKPANEILAKLNRQTRQPRTPGHLKAQVRN
jgi:transposase